MQNFPPSRIPDPSSRSASARTRNDLTDAVALYTQTRRYGQQLGRLPAADARQIEQWKGAVDTVVSTLGLHVADAARQHPMWPWIIERVEADPIIIGRLLSRLDPARASSPSSFWRYCGLATVRAIAMRCDRCGQVANYAPGHGSTVCGRRLGEPKRRCGGMCRPAGDSSTARIAQRRAQTMIGRPAPYDPEARTAAYLLGHYLIGRSVRYNAAYHAELARLFAARRDWSQQHRMRAARRRVTKTFLADLWVAWRQL